MSGPWMVLFIVQWIVLLGVLLVVIALARQVGVLLLRLGPAVPREVGAGPRLGHPAPTLAGLTGRPWRYDEPMDGTVVLFVSAECSVCDLAVSAVPRLRSRFPETEVCAVVTGDPESAVALGSKTGLPLEQVYARPELVVAFGVSEVPFAVFVDRTGLVRARGVANNREHLEELVLEGRRSASHAALHAVSDDALA